MCIRNKQVSNWLSIMKQLSTITIKLSMVIIAAVSIISACSMNCGCCDPQKAQTTETAICCTDPAASISLIPLVSTTLNETSQDACNSCNCTAVPQKESNAVSSSPLSLKLLSAPVSAPKHSYFALHNYSIKTSIASQNVLSAPLIPLRI
jgi:hypothetical protein